MCTNKGINTTAHLEILIDIDIEMHIKTDIATETDIDIEIELGIDCMKWFQISEHASICS